MGDCPAEFNHSDSLKHTEGADNLDIVPQIAQLLCDVKVIPKLLHQELLRIFSGQEKSPLYP